MEKLYITEEIANHEANKHLNLEVGTDLEINTEDCDQATCSKKPVMEGQNGHWTCSFGECIFVPAP